MIVVDSSALVAIFEQEADALRFPDKRLTPARR
jgi:uncharacterized protein with PIN domain